MLWANRAETPGETGTGAMWRTAVATVHFSSQWRKEQAAPTSSHHQQRIRRNTEVPADTGCIFTSRQADQSQVSAPSTPASATAWGYVTVLSCPTANDAAAMSILCITVQSHIGSGTARQVPGTTRGCLPQKACPHLGIASRSSFVQGENQCKETLQRGTVCTAVF